jgi:hypothetical protein
MTSDGGAAQRTTGAESRSAALKPAIVIGDFAKAWRINILSLCAMVNTIF